MAQYPDAVAAFTTKESLRGIEAEHINSIQDEIGALTDALLNGFAHDVFPDADATYDLGALATRWRDLILSAGLTIGDGLDVTGNLSGASLAVTGNLDGGTLTGDGSGITGVTGAATPLPAGTILLTGCAAAPADWLLCDGSAVNRTTYADLFAVIGETFGPGDGLTTFNLPDLRGAFPIGVGTHALGETGGAIDHTHTLVAHIHGTGTLTVASHSHTVGTLATTAHSHSDGTLAASSGGSHDHTVNGHTHGTGTYAVGSHSHTISKATAGFAVPPPGGITMITSINASTGSTAPSFSGSSGSASPDTNSAGSHSHTITGTTGSAAPAVSGSTGSAQPAMSGDVASDGSGTSGAANPAFLAVNYIIRT